MNYKKPAFWMVVVTVVVGLAVAACFLTNPISESKEPDKNADPLAVIGGADGPSVVVVGDLNEDADSLIDSEGNVLGGFSSPRYGTDEEGLYVFIWQLGENSYSCCVKEKTKEGYTNGELWNMKSIRMEDARRVVKNSEYPKETVTVVPFGMPYSSYLNLEAQQDPEGYCRKLEMLFWEE